MRWKIFEEIMAEDFTNLAEDVNIMIQDAQWTHRINPQSSASRYIKATVLEAEDSKIMTLSGENSHVGEQQLEWEAISR